MQSVRGCVLAVPLHSRNPCAIYALYESIAFKVYYKFTFVVCRTKKNQLGVQTQFTGAGRKARPLACRKSATLQGEPISARSRATEIPSPWYPPGDKIKRRTAHSVQRASHTLCAKGCRFPNFRRGSQPACKFGRLPQLRFACFCRRQRLNFAVLYVSRPYAHVVRSGLF